ncbi:hypothetical protein [Sphingosinithalassobacter portus]|uniref:hypothetical protein n=1 Tax=Stakelama portus TaxID=2676234 RepID=UPI000D6E29B0|nr:hypothetical protein [Sphingosinithalassobacter portus]
MTNKLFFAAAFALGLAATPAAAKDPEVRQFSHEGISYTYSVDETDHGTVYRGSTSRGSRFRLVVAHGRVRGKFNGHQVNFPVADSQALGVEMGEAVVAAR